MVGSGEVGGGTPNARDGLSTDANDFADSGQGRLDGRHNQFCDIFGLCDQFA
jgi:hypothetical protein